MDTLSYRRAIAVVLCAVFFNGCATLPPPVQGSRPQEVSCDGAFTQVNGQTMNLKETGAFYRLHGDRKAADLVLQAQRARSSSRFKWVIASGIGAGIGATTAVGLYSASHGNDEFAASLAVALGVYAGFLLGLPVGLFQSFHLNQLSKQKALEAASAYNADLALSGQALPIRPNSRSLPKE